jgi:hypothetical protein
MMKREEFTPQKRQQTTTDNEEANLAHKKEIRRQGHCNFNNKSNQVTKDI